MTSGSWLDEYRQAMTSDTAGKALRHAFIRCEAVASTRLIEYRLQHAQGLSADELRVAHDHVQQMNLLHRYRVAAIAELARWRKHVRTRLVSDVVQKVKDLLVDDRSEFGLNHWRTLLFEEIVQSPWVLTAAGP